jgi:hypothetical protein
MVSWFTVVYVSIGALFLQLCSVGLLFLFPFNFLHYLLLLKGLKASAAKLDLRSMEGLFSTLCYEYYLIFDYSIPESPWNNFIE